MASEQRTNIRPATANMLKRGTFMGNLLGAKTASQAIEESRFRLVAMSLI
jgi:hypothetical protein